MSSYGVILDIEGCDVALATDARLEARHASTVRVALDPGQVPAGMVVSVDPDSGDMDAGGMTINIRGDLADLFEAQAEVGGGVVTRLDGEITAGALSIDVLDASGLPSSGTVWIGQEAINYASKTSNTLNVTSISQRGVLSTRAQAHRDLKRVYGYNPKLLGRQIWITWQDTFNPEKSAAVTRYVGFIDAIDDTDTGCAIQVVSGQGRFRDQAIFAGASWFKGTLARTIDDKVNSLKISLEDKDTLPPGENSNTYGRGYIRIGDEILEVGNWFTPLNSSYPILEGTINTATGDTLSMASIPGDLEVEDQVDLESSGGTVKATVTVLAIDRDAGTVTVGSSDYSHASGDKLVMNYTAIAPFQQVKRAVLGGGPAVAHEKGAEVTEVRILEGDSLLDVLLPALLSVDGSRTNGPDSGAYDTLPSGWGLGLPEDFVDVDSFLEAVALGASQDRYYPYDEDLPADDLRKLIAMSHNLSIYWSHEGKITCTVISDIYPDTTVDHTLTESWRKRGEGWSLSSDASRIRTVASVGMDRDLPTDTYLSRLIVEVDDAIDLHGRLEFELEDPGIRSAASEVLLFEVLAGFIRQRSIESWRITYKVRLAPGTNYAPGQLVSLTLPNVPNYRGGRGISGSIYQIVRVSPTDSQGMVELELLYRDTPGSLGLVAPCALVGNVLEGNVVRLDQASVSLFADPDGRTQATPELQSGEDGTEDADFFLVGDLITFWDESTLGGTPTTSDHEITAVDAAAREITVSPSPPGWLGNGDLLKLRPWSTFTGSASTAAKREGIFLALADGDVDPIVLGSDTPYLWGD